MQLNVWRPLSILLLLCSILLLCGAAPIQLLSPDPASLVARNNQCPSIDAFREHIRNKGTSANTVFYTNPASGLNARSFVLTLKPHGRFYGDVVSQNDQLKWLDECGHDPVEQEKMTIRVSIALAREASGTAYVLVGGPINPNSIWTRYEFPALQRNVNVHQVYAYDVNAKKQTLIWTGGNAPTLEEHTV